MCIMFIPEGCWGKADCLEANKRYINGREVRCCGKCRGQNQEPKILTKWIVMEKTDEGGQYKVKVR